jgi:transcription elongation factor Elf1
MFQLMNRLCIALVFPLLNVDLSEPIDVYSEWIDECERSNAPGGAPPTSAGDDGAAAAGAGGDDANGESKASNAVASGDGETKGPSR